MTAFPLNETSWLSAIEPVNDVQLPAFYRTQFTLPENYTICLDTYLDTSGWTKVLIIIILGVSDLYTYIKKIVFLFLNIGCSIFKRHKLGSVLATWWTSSYALCTSNFSTTTTQCEHTCNV